MDTAVLLMGSKTRNRKRGYHFEKLPLFTVRSTSIWKFPLIVAKDLQVTVIKELRTMKTQSR